MNKRIISLLVLSILVVLSMTLCIQAQDYTKQIEQWDEDLYLVNFSDLQGNFNSSALFNVDPEPFELVFDQGQPSDVLSNDVLNAKMNLPGDPGGIKPYDVCVNPDLNKIYVYGNQGLMVINSITKQIMPFNAINNKLYCGSLGFANVSAIKIGEDKLGLNYGWRWISFPRMERYAFNDDPFHPVPIMKNTTLFDDGLEFFLHGQYDQYKHYNPNMPDPWSGLLYEVKSTLGYKYEVSPADLNQPFQTLKGARLYPGCPVELPAPGEEKWIGYFLEDSQYPWDAFPPDIYNEPEGLSSIQAQYWSMKKICDLNGNCGWIISGKVSPIKYGDMVIIKYQGSDPYFVWNNPEDSEEDKDIPKPQAYTWEEKADYVPFYIETDSISDVEEIAVIVEGACMGATVRQPGDTLVEVDGYLGELPAGATVEFETWNGYKSTPVARNGYVVFDPSTQKKEKRNIYVGEKQDFYMVSFKTGEVFENPGEISQISCNPNPFRNEMILTMRLNYDQHIVAEVYNLQGAKIKTLLNSDLPGGYYEVQWKGDNESGNKVLEGVYFYKIKTGNGTEFTDKIIMIK